MDYFTLTLCGQTRKLPLVYVGRKTRLANFSLLGDTKLTTAIAKTLATKLRPITFDYLVGPEVKVVPLICELSRLLKHDRFIICRKSVKPYMVSPIIIKPLAHFPRHVQPLVIDGPDAQRLQGKRVVIVDDVISTGVTIRQLKHLMEKVGAEVVQIVAVLKQGSQFDPMDNLYYLGELPILQDPS